MQLRKKKIDIDDHFTFSSGKYSYRSAKNVKPDITANLYEVKEMIDEHIENVHTNLTDNAVRTIEYVQNARRKISHALQAAQSQRTAKQIKLDPSLDALSQLWDQVAASHDTESNDMQQKYNPSPRIVSGHVEQKIAHLNDGSNKKMEKTREIAVDSKLEFFDSRFRRDNTQNNIKLTKGEQVLQNITCFLFGLLIHAWFIFTFTKKPGRLEVEVEFEEPNKKGDGDEAPENNEVDGEKGGHGEREEAEEEFEDKPSSGNGGIAGLIASLSGVREIIDIRNDHLFLC